MSDFAARRAQRAATLGNDPQDRARWLGERMRAGLTTRDQYLALLLVGDEGAEAILDPGDAEAVACVGRRRVLHDLVPRLCAIPGVLPRLALSAARSRLRAEEAKAEKIRGARKRVAAAQRLRSFARTLDLLEGALGLDPEAFRVRFDETLYAGFDYGPGERWISSIVHGLGAQGRDDGHFFLEAIGAASEGMPGPWLDSAFVDARKAVTKWAYGAG